ncbi:MAG TPA: hypothetical protein VGD17_14610 [Chitinophagaceae bacterium]
MKQVNFPLMLLFTAALFLLSSCGGEATKDETSSDTTTLSTTDTTAVATNTIITTPQGMMIATHKVANYEKWLASYEAHDSLRLASGVHSYVIGRGMQDSNMVLVAVKVDDMEKAKTFSKSSHLKQAMQKGGVVGAPSISFVTATWQDTAMLSGSTLRSRTSFSVKDWTAWERNFVDGRPERLANGIVDRVYGHEADDSTKILLVTAVTDTAKAFAYYKSDELKKRREAGGVTTEPKRFLFYIAKRY